MHLQRIAVPNLPLDYEDGPFCEFYAGSVNSYCGELPLSIVGCTLPGLVKIMPDYCNALRRITILFPEEAKIVVAKLVKSVLNGGICYGRENVLEDVANIIATYGPYACTGKQLKPGEDFVSLTLKKNSKVISWTGDVVRPGIVENDGPNTHCRHMEKIEPMYEVEDVKIEDRCQV